MFQLFDELGIVKRIGPGTVANPSNNITAAQHLADRLLGMLYITLPVSDLLRFIRPVANLAAKAYLASEGKIHAAIYETRAYP